MSLTLNALTNQSEKTLQLRLSTMTNSQVLTIAPQQVVIASWTGRDHAAMEGRLVELEELGIPRPPTLPMFYRIASARLTTAKSIEVIGTRTSGEAEFVILQYEGKLWIGVGSDHTDRAVESQDAALSKQLCDKPICAEWWSFEELEGHWDSLRLRSFVTTPIGDREIYQEGSVKAMLPPRDLVQRWSKASTATDCGLLFCGTLPTYGGIRPASRFEFELEDPVLGRCLSHAYDVVTFPRHLNA